MFPRRRRILNVLSEYKRENSVENYQRLLYSLRLVG
jgi:hypothetical protein